MGLSKSVSLLSSSDSRLAHCLKHQIICQRFVGDLLAEVVHIDMRGMLSIIATSSDFSNVAMS